ncbi:hypothetical protein D3C75_1174270 [compost metagenome]
MLETHHLVHLRQRVGHGISVVLRGNCGHGRQRALVQLLVLRGRQPEQLRKTQPGFFRIMLIPRPGQSLGHLYGGVRGHLLRPDYQHQLGAAGQNRIDPRLNRRRA